MPYSSDPKAYPSFFTDLVLAILDNKEKMEVEVGRDERLRKRIRSQFYGLQRAFSKQAQREKDPTMAAEYQRRADRMLRYTVIIEPQKATVEFINKDAYYNKLITAITVSEEKVEDFQAFLIDQKYARVDPQFESVVQERLGADIKSPFKPHSPDDPNSALNQPITQDDMEKLLMGETDNGPPNPQK